MQTVSKAASSRNHEKSRRTVIRIQTESSPLPHDIAARAWAQLARHITAGHEEPALFWLRTLLQHHRALSHRAEGGK